MSWPIRYKCPDCRSKFSLQCDTITLDRAKFDKWREETERDEDGRFLVKCGSCDNPGEGRMRKDIVPTVFIYPCDEGFDIRVYGELAGDFYRYYEPTTEQLLKFLMELYCIPGEEE